MIEKDCLIIIRKRYMHIIQNINSYYYLPLLGLDEDRDADIDNLAFKLLTMSKMVWEGQGTKLNRRVLKVNYRSLIAFILPNDKL